MTLARLIRINNNLLYTARKLFKENYVPYTLAVYDIQNDPPETEEELLNNIERISSVIKAPEYAYLKGIGKNKVTK